MGKKITLDDKYELGHGAGCWAKSYESATINLGDVRLIGNVLMSAWHITRPPWYSLRRDEVWWTPVDRDFNTPENQRQWLNRSFV